MLDALEGSAELLAGSDRSARVEVVGFSHAMASSTEPGADREIVKRIQKVCKVPATTTLTAVVEALRHLKVKRISAALPYNMRERNKQLKTFLEGNGFRVDNVLGGPLVAGPEVPNQPLSTAYSLLKRANTPGAEAVVMPNPNFRTIEVIAALERDLGKKVITGNQAIMWHSLRLAEVSEPRSGFGKLFEE
jgi:maleate isomerase